MIELFSGTPGSGKSLHTAAKIKKWIHTFKCPVVGNFEFNVWACRPRGYGSYFHCPNDKLTPAFLLAFSELYRREKKVNHLPEDSILLVIDECQLLFNAREWQKVDRAGWLSFFTQHRKLGYRVLLIAQFDRMIDRQIRSNIEYEYLHRKVSNIGAGGKIMSFLAGGNLHVAVKIYSPLKEKVDQEFFKAKKKTYMLYDSYVVFDGSV